MDKIITIIVLSVVFFFIHKYTCRIYIQERYHQIKGRLNYSVWVWHGTDIIWDSDNIDAIGLTNELKQIRIEEAKKFIIEYKRIRNL